MHLVVIGREDVFDEQSWQFFSLWHMDLHSVLKHMDCVRQRFWIPAVHTFSAGPLSAASRLVQITSSQIPGEVVALNTL